MVKLQMASVQSNLDRREAVARLLSRREDALVVTGLGSPSYDVHAQGDDDRNYYLWGAMGSAALVGLGLAQARPDRQVIVVTGDGEQLMGLGGLATIAVAAPGNLTVVVIDNGHFGETGMQVSHTGCGLDLASIATACGFAQARTIKDLDGIDSIDLAPDRGAGGPELYVIKVKAENLPRSLPPRDAVHVKNRFRAVLGLATA
ncbi:thiamine pyrophosphate-dependent enzyme [Azospirillum endophyticum]